MRTVDVLDVTIPVKRDDVIRTLVMKRFKNKTCGRTVRERNAARPTGGPMLLGGVG